MKASVIHCYPINPTNHVHVSNIGVVVPEYLAETFMTLHYYLCMQTIMLGMCETYDKLGGTIE